MALILQVVAGILVLIGAGTLYWGTDPALLSLGNTVMIVGAVICGSGIVLFGLGVVAGQVVRLGHRLDLVADALAAGRRTEVSAAALPTPVLPRDVEAMAPLPPDLDLGLTEPPRPSAQAVTPPSSPVRSESVAASGPAPAPTPVPPSRQSFGLPPLAGQAPFGAAAAGVAAGAVVGGLAAGLGSAARAEPSVEERAAEKPVDSEPLAIEPVMLEPVKVEAVIPAIVSPDKVEPDLAHAVEDLKDEVKAAEADLAPSPSTAEETPDHLASLERILLGAASEVRAPATPDPEPVVMPPHREPEPVAVDEAEGDSASADDKARSDADAESAVPQVEPVIATDDFMARLRETLARPVAPPEPAPVADRMPAPADEARHAPTPSPVLSIEEELERALQASLATAPVAPAPQPVIVPAPVQVEPPRIEPARVEPSLQAAARDGRPPDAMAALAKDFPELNDILAPKAPPADPAASLLDDLKGIFAEPKSAAMARQEPVVAAPPPPPPAPSSPPLLREGVIATIPFRLYGDGTIEADLAEGTTRFASLKDFRAHVGG